MEDPRDRVLRLEAEIVRLIEEWRQASRLCDSEQSECYISRIPTETLTSIFVVCVQANEDVQIPAMTSPPMVFLSVCKRWRQIAMRTPALWSTFDASIESIDDVFEMTRWLKLADQHPLSISLDTGLDQDLADLAMDVLLEHQSSWSKIHIHWGPDETAPLLANTFTTKGAPLLQEFKIFTDFYYEGEDDMDGKTDARLGKLLKYSHQIHTFEWQTGHSIVANDVSPIHLAGIPFTRLRHLKLDYMMAFDCCLEVMRRAPLLESCEFTFVGNHCTHNLDQVHLPHLHSLYVRTDRYMEDFLNGLVLPSLRCIKIEFRATLPYDDVDCEDPDMLPAWPHVAFLSLIQRSSCPLEELYFVAPITEDQLIEYLQILSPTLTTITLRGKHGWSNIDHRLLGLLTHEQAGSDAVLCPNLRKISFDDCSMMLPENSMADMIQSRVIFTDTSGCNPAFEVCLVGPENFICENDWRRLKVLSKRSAGKANITLKMLPRRV
ncbi:hypothetical protein FIBSPDRAFT_1049029 [Athelia psychrophila]|uniref:Uncharacterized protein n=1 Tax=Athelia psychrophila TaxID=1759441 RepID=A0A166CX02_9AGAM|nr:hypothetical protein FIBSPDRAFT_1049029 [Fibularhizoctonia sp. CBS 109695]